MVIEDRYTRFVAERVTSPPLTTGDTLYWDGLGAASQGVGRPPVLEPVAPPACRAPPRARGGRASPVVPPRPPPGRLLVPPTPVIEWVTEAATLSVYLHPSLLAPVHDLRPGATGDLIWVPWHHQPTSPRAGHPALLVQTPAAPLQAACVELVLCLPLHDLLLQPIALVLQATVAAEDVAEQLYAAALAEALVGHVLRRYAAARPAQRAATGGFAPYKLRRTLAYIQAHLEEPVSLTRLAAVAQMSTTHFAHLFKEATGLPPHQYVLRCRMEHAKRLLADTDMPLIEVGLQVGCMDQSHFTALFRTYVAMTPKAYRSHTRGQFV